MSRSRTWYRRIGTAFDKDNPLACLMWALVGLRGDLSYEYLAIGGPDEMHGKGDDRQAFARTYFFRGTMRSLYSLGKVLRQLMKNAEFKELRQRNRVLDAEFMAAKKLVDKQAPQFERLRNEFGAHAEGYSGMLERVPPDEVVGIEIDESFLTLKLATRVVLSAFTKEQDDAEKIKLELEHLLVPLARATHAALHTIDLALGLYSTRYDTGLPTVPVQRDSGNVP